MKIQELEMKLQEEEHQRKLLQDKANQVTVSVTALALTADISHHCNAGLRLNVTFMRV